MATAKEKQDKPPRQVAYFDRMKAKGFVSVRLWIPKGKVATIKATAKALREPDNGKRK